MKSLDFKLLLMIFVVVVACRNHGEEGGYLSIRGRAVFLEGGNFRIANIVSQNLTADDAKDILHIINNCKDALIIDGGEMDGYSAANAIWILRGNGDVVCRIIGDGLFVPSGEKWKMYNGGSISSKIIEMIKRGAIKSRVEKSEDQVGKLPVIQGL